MPDLFERPSLPPPSTGFKFLDGLRTDDVAYPRRAAERIAKLDEAVALDAAIAEVPPEWLQYVLTMAVTGIAMRIARIEPKIDTEYGRIAARDRRRAELDKLPADLRARVEPHVVRLFHVKPWRREPSD